MRCVVSATPRRSTREGLSTQKVGGGRARRDARGCCFNEAPRSPPRFLDLTFYWFSVNQFEKCIAMLPLLTWGVLRTLSAPDHVGEKGRRGRPGAFTADAVLPTLVVST